MTLPDDRALMALAIIAAEGIGREVSPNPGVGCAIRAANGQMVVSGRTQPPGGRHAEIDALTTLRDQGGSSIGATVATTLEPCSHFGRTGPCADALIDAGVARVIVALEDPDPKVAGNGIAKLRNAGIAVALGEGHNDAAEQLRFYLHHRRTGRPYVTLKLAASLDGRTAAPDHTSQWITSVEARTDAHRLRATHDAILVGAGTIRDDDPTLTVRHVEGRDPLRVVLGRVPESAKARPCRELSGDLHEVLVTLGADGVVSVLVEGGATVAHAFHQAGLVNEYVVYLAPMLFGGGDALGLFRGSGAPTISAAWRGRVQSLDRVGEDVRLIVRP